MKSNSTTSVPKTRNQRGFTLIEIVVGMVVLAVALTIVSGVFLPQANKTTSQMYQIKATALGKRIMDQVLIRYYDDASTNSGGFIRCGETVLTSIPFHCSAKLGTEGGEVSTDPDKFNDVDDYNVYCHDQTGYDPSAALGYFTNQYPGYGLQICVSFAADKFDPSVGSGVIDVAKRIQVTVFMPDDDSIQLTAFKGNY